MPKRVRTHAREFFVLECSALPRDPSPPHALYAVGGLQGGDEHARARAAALTRVGGEGHQDVRGGLSERKV